MKIAQFVERNLEIMETLRVASLSKKYGDYSAVQDISFRYRRVNAWGSWVLMGLVKQLP